MSDKPKKNRFRITKGENKRTEGEFPSLRDVEKYMDVMQLHGVEGVLVIDMETNTVVNSEKDKWDATFKGKDKE